MRKHTVKSLLSAKHRLPKKKLNMLTCYDYQTAQILNDSYLDMVLVGDSLGNVILGHETTVSVTLTEMSIFASAVKRGAPDKFVVADLPFGSYSTFDESIINSTHMFQKTNVEALKLEGSNPTNLQIIQRLVEIGIPIMGHIGLMPQSVHSQGGYYTHGKTSSDQNRLIQEAKQLEKAGCFAVVLECIEEQTTKVITEHLTIPTIGIGSGPFCDGQVLVLNDLLGLTPQTPNFVSPLGNLRQQKSDIINTYLDNSHDTYS